jgi:hypothetical protein
LFGNSALTATWKGPSQMPTDHFVIKWSCDLCGETWTGPYSEHAAAVCEATGVPEWLPV